VSLDGLLPVVAGDLKPIIVQSSNLNYTRTSDAIDVPAYAAKLPAGTRVLVTDGTADTKVPTFTIRPLIGSLTRAGTTGPGLQTLPGIDHDLNPAGTPANGAPLDPGFLAVLKDWAQPYGS
jgi:hypothetical protein